MGRGKRIVVTPAGRTRYLEILHACLAKQTDAFDQWLLLVNTTDPRDIGYCERLAARNPDWIDTRYAEGSEPARGNLNIHKFLNQFCRDPETTYLRLDDDIAYLAPGFVERIFAFRESHPEPFLVYGNIVNNAIVSWLHQKFGNFAYEAHSGYECTDRVGWGHPPFAQELHEAFLRDPADPKWEFKKWVATEYERVSVNAVSWFGKDLAEKPVEEDEELWLAVVRPKELKRPNVVCGTAVCVHFAFHTQRDHLEKTTDLLERYKALAFSTDSSPGRGSERVSAKP